MEGGAWWTTAHGVAKSWTRLSDFTFTSTLDLYFTYTDLYSFIQLYIRTGHGTTDWFQIGKGVRQGCIFSSCLS